MICKKCGYKQIFDFSDCPKCSYNDYKEYQKKKSTNNTEKIEQHGITATKQTKTTTQDDTNKTSSFFNTDAPPIFSKIVKCPYCAEEISSEAIKCKHCGEFLDTNIRNERLRENARISRNETLKPVNKFSYGATGVYLLFQGIAALFFGLPFFTILGVISIVIAIIMFSKASSVK